MSKTYVWYSKATSKTGKALAMSLGLSENPRDRECGTKVPPTGTTHVICWGARQPKNRVEFRRRNLERRTVLNNPYKSETFKNKFIALYKMNASGVSVPKHTKEKYHVIHNFSFPIVGRKYHHQGGSGFDFIEDTASLMNSDSDYFMEYIHGEDKREYRVHVFNGEVVRVQRKKPKVNEDGEEIEPRSYVCKSHDNGWRFSLCDISRVHSSIIENAILAVNSLNLDFGAVDIIRVPSTDTTVVLEVNTGMGLDDAGLEFYTQQFKRWLE